MSRVIISTDSPADLPPELVERYGIVITPLHIILDGNDLLDGITVKPDDIMVKYAGKKVLPTTSAIPVGEYQRKFAELTAKGDSVVHISLSSGVSSTYKNATLAAEEIENVWVVDSLELSSAIAVLVVHAAVLAQQGLEAAEIAAKIEAMRSKVDISFVLENLEFMAKGGRCSTVAALGANILGIRPCLEMRDGTLAVCKKYRGKIDKVQEQYLAERLEAMGECDDTVAFVTHSPMAKEQADKLTQAVRASGKFKEVFETHAGCTIVSHCGPNCIGVIALKK